MGSLIKPPRLNHGDTVGLLAPSYAAKPENIENTVRTLTSLGFGVKLSEHIYSTSLGFAGTAAERAADFNAMIADPDVKMLLFGGGEVSNEILPLIDYENIAKNPKIICSYSDSTTILNAVYCRSSLVTFYGASPRTFEALADYNLASLKSRLMSPSDTHHETGGGWRAITPGRAEGILIGGYLVNFAAMLGGGYFSIDQGEKYLLFIEDHEKFSPPAVVSKWFSHIEQSGLFQNVAGLLFGHYSAFENPRIDEILMRIGERYSIPVVRCEDFGHGSNNAILPIGIGASLEASPSGCGFGLTGGGVV